MQTSSGADRGGPFSAPATLLAGLRVLFFGACDTDYPRNRVIRRVLRQAGAEVLEVTDTRPFLGRTPALVRRSRGTRPDIVFVGFPAYADVVTARAVARSGAKVVFDPLKGLHETDVGDRRSARPWTLRSARYAIEDLVSCRSADCILLDTECHISYFSRRTGLPTSRFRKVWLGTDDEVMHPRPEPPDPLSEVFFYGNVAPIHGLEHILGAALLLQDRGTGVSFTVVTGRSQYQAVQREVESRRLHHVRVLPEVPYGELPGLMSRSRLCLGVFGTSGKASRVIPNKAFDALALAKPLITADSPAAREALVHGEHAWLCPPGDPHALADAVWRVLSDTGLQEALARKGHDLFERVFSSAALGVTLTRIFEDLVQGRGSAPSVIARRRP